MESKENQPYSFGSNKPGTLPARRPCFTTAKLSLGKPTSPEETKEIPDSKTDFLFKIPENYSDSPSTKTLPLEPEPSFVLEIPFSFED